MSSPDTGEDALRAQLLRLVVEVGELDDPARVTDHAHLVRDLGINSMRGLELILLCEEELGLAVPEKALYEIHTFGDIVRYALELRAGGNRP